MAQLRWKLPRGLGILRSRGRRCRKVRRYCRDFSRWARSVSVCSEDFRGRSHCISRYRHPGTLPRDHFCPRGHDVPRSRLSVGLSAATSPDVAAPSAYGTSTSADGITTSREVAAPSPYLQPMSPDGASPSPSLARASVDGITTFREVAALLPYLRWLLLMEQLCHLTLRGLPETES